MAIFASSSFQTHDGTGRLNCVPCLAARVTERSSAYDLGSVIAPDRRQRSGPIGSVVGGQLAGSVLVPRVKAQLAGTPRRSGERFGAVARMMP
jgi:hypothetical protein